MIHQEALDCGAPGRTHSICVFNVPGCVCVEEANPIKIAWRYIDSRSPCCFTSCSLRTVSPPYSWTLKILTRAETRGNRNMCLAPFEFWSYIALRSWIRFQFAISFVMRDVHELNTGPCFVLHVVYIVGFGSEKYLLHIESPKGSPQRSNFAANFLWEF